MNCGEDGNCKAEQERIAELEKTVRLLSVGHLKLPRRESRMAIEIMISELAEKIDRLSAQLEALQLSNAESDGKIGLDVKEAAELAGLSENTMRMWVVSGYAPNFKVKGRIKISRRALDEWMYEKSIERARIDVY